MGAVAERAHSYAQYGTQWLRHTGYGRTVPYMRSHHRNTTKTLKGDP